MQQPNLRRAVRPFGAGVFAFGLAVISCSDNPVTPAAPTEPAGPSETLTITADGVFPSITSIDTGVPITIVNNDTQPHRLHLDFAGQPGCTAFDSAGEVPPGESRVTGVLTPEATGCEAHDHMHHGDSRFTVRILAGEPAKQ